MESGNKLTFNYNIEFLCWNCYGECEGIVLRKFVGQIQSDLHVLNWVCPSRDNMNHLTWNNPVSR